MAPVEKQSILMVKSWRTSLSGVAGTAMPGPQVHHPGASMLIIGTFAMRARRTNNLW